MIIDFHVHCFPDELAGRAVEVLGEKAGISAVLNGTVGDIRESMARTGVDRSVVLSIATKPQQTEVINDWSVEIQSSNEGVTAFGSVHPEYEGWRDELKRINELGLKGIKFHPEYQEFFVDEKRMFPIYDAAFELGMIIVFHAGVDIGMPFPYHCTPDRLCRVVKAFPGGRIVAAHMGGFMMWDDVEKFLVGQDVYFDTSYSMKHIDEAQLRRIINNHGYERILFATDSPWSDQRDEIMRLRKLGLGEPAEKAILGENAFTLLGMG